MINLNITDNTLVQLVEYINETRNKSYKVEDIVEVTTSILNLEVRFKSEYVVTAINNKFFYNWWINKLTELQTL